jgi:hypothetical protein
MTRRLTLSAAAALTLVALAAPSATASTATKPATNLTFAGYITTPKAHITKANVSFVVPSITCKGRLSGVGPSIQIDSTVNKKTNTFSVAGGGIAVACEHSKVVYEALVIVNGVNDNAFQVAAGDHVTVSVKYGTKTVSTVTDTTSKAHKTDSAKASVGQSAFVGDSGVQVGSQNLGIDQFTVTHFTDATVNGHTLAKVKAQQTDWIDKHKVILIAASKLGKDGKSFTTTFKHSS